MAGHELSQEEKNTLKVLKKQADDLEALQTKTDNQAERLQDMGARIAELKRRVLRLADTKHVVAPEEKHAPATMRPERPKISPDSIPSWESLQREAATETTPDIADFLTSDDIDAAKAAALRISRDYKKKTELTPRDKALLTMATSIHSARWLVTGKIIGKLGKPLTILGTLATRTTPALETLKLANVPQLEDKSPTDDTSPADASDISESQELTDVEELTDEINEEFQEEIALDADDLETVEGEKVYKSWQEIIDQKPNTSVSEDKKMKNPALGWFFGVMNRLTGTVTTKDFSSFDAESGTPVKTTSLLNDAFNSIKEDWLRLPAAVFAQYKETNPDYLKKIGLPTIKAEEFSPEMVGELYKHQFNQLTGMEKVTLVGKQAVIPLMVNMSIGLLHSYMYNPEVDGDRKFYEARTRKIILYSNALASSGNLTFSAATKNIAKLDLGGTLVTGTRALQDLGYLTKLKDEYLKEEIENTFRKEFEDIENRFE